MHYEGNVIRPPSEADSIILQVTRGCSHNKCSFCGTYRGLRFGLKSMEIIDADLDFAARYCAGLKTVFLADGDVLVLPQKKLVAIFHKVRKKLPWITRIRLYGNEKSIRRKSGQELQALKQLGLDRIYLGLESGHDPTLLFINKGASSTDMIAAAAKVRSAGIFLSATVLLGIAGKKYSQEHAVATGKVVSAMQPNQIAVLTLMLLPNTPLHDLFEKGEFELPEPLGLLRELKTLVANIDVSRSQFQANHASNYLPVSIRLPKDKELLLAKIEEALAGETSLKPEHLRGL